jgi:hypothetical protein
MVCGQTSKIEECAAALRAGLQARVEKIKWKIAAGFMG